MVNVKEDLTGKIFGRLTVIEQSEDCIFPNGQHKAQWLCRCDCGNEIIVLGHSLKHNKTKSCGCFQRESRFNNKNNKKYNIYDLSGDYGIGYTSKGEKFYFDLEDYDKIKNHCWYINNQGYVVAHDSLNNKSQIRFHRLVMDITNIDLFVDHIHGIKSRNDNRKYNLRIVTRNQNGMNRGMPNNNTSGAVGVHWCKQKNKWTASIRVNKKQIHLGTFENFEDAVKVRKEAEEEYFGEYSYDNSMAM